MLLRISLAVSLAAIVFAGQAEAGSVLADGYNEFSFGNSTRSGDTEGTAAVGGKATYNNFSINSSNQTSPTYALLVGGQLAGSQTNMQHGSASYDSKASGTNLYFNGGGTGTQQASPINFSAMQTSLTSLSSSLGGLANSNMTFANASGTITLTGTGTAGSTEVYNLNGSTLFPQNPAQTIYDLDIKATAGATVIINISGNNLALSDLTTNITGTSASNVLYNFTGATGSTSNYGLTLTSDEIDGTILAPSAFVSTSNGQLHGQIIDQELDGSIETHTDVSPFSGTLPPSVPEPSSMVLALTACVVGLLPMARRRFRALTI